jgi:hypothetical protein
LCFLRSGIKMPEAALGQSQLNPSGGCGTLIPGSRCARKGVAVERCSFLVSLAAPFKIAQRNQIYGDPARMVDGSRDVECPAKFLFGRGGITESQLQIS